MNEVPLYKYPRKQNCAPPKRKKRTRFDEKTFGRGKITCEVNRSRPKHLSSNLYRQILIEYKYPRCLEKNAKRPPPRSTIGPYASPCCRVLGADVFFKTRYPCTGEKAQR